MESELEIIESGIEEVESGKNIFEVLYLLTTLVVYIVGLCFGVPLIQEELPGLEWVSYFAGAIFNASIVFAVYKYMDNHFKKELRRIRLDLRKQAVLQQMAENERLKKEEVREDERRKKEEARENERRREENERRQEEDRRWQRVISSIERNQQSQISGV